MKFDDFIELTTLKGMKFHIRASIIQEVIDTTGEGKTLITKQGFSQGTYVRESREEVLDKIRGKSHPTSFVLDTPGVISLDEAKGMGFPYISSISSVQDNSNERNWLKWGEKPQESLDV